MQKNYLLKSAKINAVLSFSFPSMKLFYNTTFTWLVLLFAFFVTNNVFSQVTVSYTATGAGTWTAPCDVTSITVEVWGAGGGGQRAEGNPAAGGGGSGGGYVRTTYAISGGTTYNLFVGAGGTGNSGGNGQSSWFNNNTTILAVGGVGAGAAITANNSWGTGANALTTGNIGGTLISTYGGNGGAAGNNFSGGGGSSAGNTNGNPGSGISGGAAPANGFVGVNGLNVNGSGNVGNVGAGGSGGRTAQNTDRSGGAGGRGEIRITYTSSFPSYCITSFTSGVEPITNVTFVGINNTTSALVGGTPQLESFCSIANVQQSTSYPISIKGNTDGNFTDNVRVYIDWDQNGVLGNLANEIYDIGTIVNSTGVDAIVLNGTIAVPAGALLGNTKMRVMKRYNGYSTSPCQTGAGFGQAEDYNVNVIAPLPCVAPTAQPTALSLTPSGSSISGSFTAASPASDSYLVVVSTSATPPTAPVNTTSYTIGGTLAPGYTIVDTDTNTTFTATGLSPLTNYYFYIYSFNGLCTGGPLYIGTSPLTGTTTTLVASYCTPTINATYQTSTNHHIRKVEFIGTLQDIVNTSSFPTIAPFGYENYTGLAVKSIQAKGEGVNIYMESPNSGYIKAWVDWNVDGDFADAGETVYNAGGTSQASTTLGFIVPTGIAAGDYRVRLRISGRNGIGADAGFAWDSCTTNLAYYGETEDYILRVVENCAARIATITNGSVCGSGVVTLQATGTVGTTEFRWYAVETGGTPLATTATGTWNTPSISTTTDYWVAAFNGSCETLVRTKINALVKPIPTLSFATSNTEVCGENSVVALTASGDNEIIHLIEENFESGLGTFSNVHNVSNPTKDAETAWQIKTSAFVPSGSGATWFPAIQSNFGANNFAFVTSDIGTSGPSTYYTVDNGLVSNTVNSTGFLNLTFTFRAYFDRYYPNGINPANELMTVDVSTNGGTTWTSLSGNITSDIGYGTRFTDYSYNLNAYINQANLKVRIRYYTNTWANGAAIDDIELFGTKPLSTALNWSGTPMPDVYTDAATTIPYVSGTPATTVYVKPVLGQLETGSYTFTATAILTNGCAVSQDITIENKSSIWKGTVNNDWNNPANWSPAVVPTANSCVIIPNSVNTSNIVGTNYNGFGKSLFVKNGGRLDVQSNNTLTITDGVTVEATGTFNLENAASLIQVNNVANSGIISMKRNVNVRKLDYVYWSSPVASFPLSSISTTVNRYKWLPTVGANLNGWGTWEVANENMVNGKGYIVRGPDSYTSTPQNYTQNFVGVPNNGNINMPISRGTYDGVNYVTGVSGTLATRNDDNWNLIGNPYPSAISANTFLATNTNIVGFVKFWTHGTMPASAASDPFYNNYGLNYSVSDYVNYNATGANPPIGNGNIAAGQGFFVLMNHSSAGVNENVVFNNSMRRNDYRNDLFYRNENITNLDTEEKHRVWLNLISPSLKSSPVLIGYTANATNDIDRMYDVPALDVKTNFELYSFSTTNKLNIQGKALPFSNDDRISLGVSIEQAGSHSIDILKVDGLFESASQNIYLEDLTLGITHDLRVSPYFFTSAVGRFENRFVLKFSNETLGNEDFNTNNVTVYTNESINVIATNQTIKSVKIHDLLGRVVGVFNTVNSNEFKTSTIAKTQSALLVEVTLENDAKQTYKVIF
jgi:hypothetical protein